MKHVQTRPKTELVSATTTAIEAQYSRGDLRARITDALQAAGKDPDRLSINELALRGCPKSLGGHRACRWLTPILIGVDRR